MAEAVELADLRWTRAQLTLRLRAANGARLDPDRLRLAHQHVADLAMPATGSQRAGDELMVRFNVMAGPGQQPLDSGVWTLTRGDGEPLRLSRAADVPLEAPASFELSRRRTYAARAFIDGDALRVDVHAPRRSVVRRRPRKLRGRIVTGLRDGYLALARRAPGRRRWQVLFLAPRRALSANMRVVHDRMLERGLDQEVDIRTLPASDRRRGGGRPMAILRKLRRLWRVSRADVLVTQNSEHQFLYDLDLPPGVRFIQLWHGAGAFKAVKYSRVGKPTGPNPYWRKHKNYTHVIVSSQHDVPFYAEAFSIPESRIVPTGIPRQDVFFDERRRTAGLAAAHRAYPQTEGKFTILFAPTYRGSAVRARYDLDKLDYPALHALCVEKDAVCIVRMHPAVHHPIGIPDELRDRLLERPAGPVDVRDLSFAVDLLITDYSSIMLDYVLLRRPMLFYAYDLDEYIGGRDFYEPYETFVPGRIVRTFEDLLDAIRRDEYDLHKVEPFIERHFAHTDGRATDRVIDQLILPSPPRA